MWARVFPVIISKYLTDRRQVARNNAPRNEDCEQVGVSRFSKSMTDFHLDFKVTIRLNSRF